MFFFVLFLSSTNGHQETGCGGVEIPLRMIYNHHPTLRGLVLPPLLMSQSFTDLSEQWRNTDIRSSRTLFHLAASLFLSTESLRCCNTQTGTSDFRSVNDCRDYCPCLWLQLSHPVWQFECCVEEKTWEKTWLSMGSFQLGVKWVHNNPEFRIYHLLLQTKRGSLKDPVNSTSFKSSALVGLKWQPLIAPRSNFCFHLVFQRAQCD